MKVFSVVEEYFVEVESDWISYAEIFSWSSTLYDFKSFEETACFVKGVLSMLINAELISLGSVSSSGDFQIDENDSQTQIEIVERQLSTFTNWRSLDMDPTLFQGTDKAISFGAKLLQDPNWIEYATRVWAKPKIDFLLPLELKPALERETVILRSYL